MEIKHAKISCSCPYKAGTGQGNPQGVATPASSLLPSASLVSAVSLLHQVVSPGRESWH